MIIFFLDNCKANLNAYLCSEIFQLLKAFPPFFENFIAFFLIFRLI